MSNPSPPTNRKPSPDPNTEKMLEAANSASQTVAALHVAFIAFSVYLGVIVWGTMDEDLLRINPVNLPILGVDLPLTTFYGIVPWLLVLLHFNLLMQLELLSRKLWNLDSILPGNKAGQQIRDRLFIFPFSHLIAGRSNVRLIRLLLSSTVGITVIVLPLVMLLAAQIRFLPYHDEGITWAQRIAVWSDALMLLALWPLIASPNDKWLEWLQNLFRVFGYWAATGWNLLERIIQHRRPGLRWREIDPRPPQTVAEAKGMFVLLVTIPLALIFSIVAVIPGSITIQAYYCQQTDVPDPRYFHDWLIHHVPKPLKKFLADKDNENVFTCATPEPPVPEVNSYSEKKVNSYSEKHKYFENWLIRHTPKAWLSVIVLDKDKNYKKTCGSLALANKSEDAGEQVMLSYTCSWLDFFSFTRNLSLTEAQLVPKEVTIQLLNSAIDPDKLVRDKAFKEFHGLKLKEGRDLRFADLSNAVLPKADLRGVWLQGANLGGAQLQGASLGNAQLQGADLTNAQLQDASLVSAKLQGANLGNAQLQDADLTLAQLQGANLFDAQLQGAHLQSAQLEMAELSSADLKGADLNNAQLRGAHLILAQLQGANLGLTKLQGADLTRAQLQGADLNGAILQGADLIEAILKGADLSGAILQGADLSWAQLQGADLTKAQLQGADLTNAQLQAAELSGANLQGIEWSHANVDNLIIQSLVSDWTEIQQRELEVTLKPLLDKYNFAAFQERMGRASKNSSPGKPASQAECYSDNTSLLKCKYYSSAQLNAYRNDVLNPQLIKLACSDAAIAKIIKERGTEHAEAYFNVLTKVDPAFGLAAALIEAANQKTCPGLAGLSEQTRQNLQEVAEEQKKETKPKLTQ